MSSTTAKPAKATTEATTKSPKTTENQSLSEKIDALNSQIDWFYGEDFVLTDASAKYKEALQLAQDIEKDLESLKNEIEIIDRDFTK